MQTVNGVISWKAVFAALTNNDLLFYDCVPILKSEWACPRITRPLIATRVVQTTSRWISEHIRQFLSGIVFMLVLTIYLEECYVFQWMTCNSIIQVWFLLLSWKFRTAPVIAGLSDIISFTTRTGTQQGVRSHVFRVETHRELAAWVKSIVRCTYEACNEINQVSCRMFQIILEIFHLEINDAKTNFNFSLFQKYTSFWKFSWILCSSFGLLIITLA